jgi:hypothetical protein
MKIGLLSDTHSYLDTKVFEYFKDVDEIWHAGDFGNISVSDKLAGFKPLRGVFGNIDGHEIREVHPLDRRFICAGMDVWMTHIGGYPGRYERRIWQKMQAHPPDIFICGHSHIVKVMRDKKYRNMLTINPGAAGIVGLHKVRTIMRFTIEKGKIDEVELIELGKRGAIDASM